MSIRRLFTALFIMLMMTVPVSAYVVNEDGSITLEYGDSYGNVAADFGLNYYNLGYYNGQNPDSDVVLPGQTIHLGESSYGSYWGGTGYTDYGYSDQTYASSGTNDYYSSYGEVYSDWSGNTWGQQYTDPYYGYSEPAYYDGTVYGSSYIATGYGDASGYNANVACQLTDGVTLAPGETYYIDNYLGDGGYGMGFIDSECLDGQGGTFLAPGGGICSVSTAIHMASKDAGLTIVRRVPHNNGDGTTGVSYASADDQAAFSAGGANLIVQNNTDQNVTLSTSYDGNGVSAKWIGNGGCFEKDNR